MRFLNRTARARAAADMAKLGDRGEAIRDLQTGVATIYRQINQGTKTAQWTRGAWTFRIQHTFNGIYGVSAGCRTKLQVKDMIEIDRIIADTGLPLKQADDDSAWWFGEVQRVSPQKRLEELDALPEPTDEQLEEIRKSPILMADLIDQIGAGIMARSGLN